MTKTEIRQLARRATQYGYFHVNATEAYVKCPHCKEEVRAYKFAWEKWTAPKWVVAFADHVEDHA